MIGPASEGWTGMGQEYDLDTPGDIITERTRYAVRENVNCVRSVKQSSNFTLETATSMSIG